MTGHEIIITSTRNSVLKLLSINIMMIIQNYFECAHCWRFAEIGYIYIYICILIGVCDNKQRPSSLNLDDSNIINLWIDRYVLMITLPATLGSQNTRLCFDLD